VRCATAPTWTPDGRVAFLSTQSPNTVAEITLIGANGSGRTSVTHDGLWRFALDWARDGTKVAYSYFKRDDATTIAAAAPTGPAPVTSLPATSRPGRPTAPKIAFIRANAGSTQVFVMDADGRNVRQLTATPSPGSSAPSWSPDGSHIAYAEAFGFTRSISVMDADGANQHPLGSLTGFDPDWSPDGKHIAYAGAAQPGGIWIADAHGTNPRRLTTGPDADPRWSPDGKSIIFSSTRNDVVADDDIAHELYLVDADGSHLRPLTFTVAAAWFTLGQVRTAHGRLLSKLEAAGMTGGVAVAGKRVAVLTHEGTDGRLTVFDGRTGTRRSRTVASRRVPGARRGERPLGRVPHRRADDPRARPADAEDAHAAGRTCDAGRAIRLGAPRRVGRDRRE
jgi:TolB protein